VEAQVDGVASFVLLADLRDVSIILGKLAEGFLNVVSLLGEDALLNNSEGELEGEGYDLGLDPHLAGLVVASQVVVLEVEEQYSRQDGCVNSKRQYEVLEFGRALAGVVVGLLLIVSRRQLLEEEKERQSSARNEEQED